MLHDPFSERDARAGLPVLQHLCGMNKSKLIVAINKDANAPIFKIADYGIVGDVHQIIPAMITELRK